MPGLAPSYPVLTERLALRPIVAGDIDDLLAYRSRPDVCRWVPFEPQDRARIEKLVAGQFARRELERAGEALFFGVEHRDSGRLIGDLMLNWASEEHRGAELGWVLNPEYGGRGFATEAVLAVMQLAFDGLGLHRLTARIDADNAASIRLAERLGMRREAHLVENEWFKGRWSDEVDYAILDREWAGRPQGPTDLQGRLRNSVT